jgi:thiol-disulfide isomerase/thioredoxin
MLSISIGPFAFPVNSLVFLASLYVGYFLLLRNKGLDKPFLEKIFFQTVFLGLLSARFVFIAMNWNSYSSSILSVLDIRDGGWEVSAGLGGSLLFLSFCSWRKKQWRRAFVLSASVSLSLWGLATVYLNHLNNKNGLEHANSVSLVALDNGQQQTLQNIVLNKPSVVNLWASWCGPCKNEMPYFAKLQKTYPQVQFVFVNQAESSTAIQKYLAMQTFSLQGVWLDSGAQLGPAVGSNGLPTTLFINAKGQLVKAHFGGLNEAALDAAIQNLLTE